MTRWHWVALAVGCALSGALGYSLRPAPEVREVERVEYRDRVIVKTVVRREEQRARVVYRERLVTPDGTIRERESEREDTRVAEHTDTAVDRTSEGTRVAERVVTPAAPVWHAGALLVLSPGALTLKDPLAALSAGVYVGRHLVGPLSIGLSATVPVQQPVSWPVLTLTLSAGF